MDILSIVFLSFALAMDCFAISIVSGILLHRQKWRIILKISFLFGLFQAIMPFIGWLCTNYFAGYIETLDHWIAFVLLAIIGIRMILESTHPEKQQTFNPEHTGTQLSLAIATSIDALAIGISFACMGYNSFTSLFVPLSLIGTVSFIAGIAGNLLGIRFGDIINRKFKPELIGGIILIVIGLRILIEHLTA